MNSAYGQLGSYGTLGAPYAGDQGLDPQMSNDIDSCWDRYPRQTWTLGLSAIIGRRKKNRDGCINNANKAYEARRQQALAEGVKVDAGGGEIGQARKDRKKKKRKKRNRRGQEGGGDPTVFVLGGLALVAVAAGVIYMRGQK